MLRDFNYRGNSIGFLRCILASAVIWSHSFGLGGFGYDPVQRFSGGTENAGTLAVAAFFLLSGFLITRSYDTSGSTIAFLWHRFLRIFPGFWICLVVTAFILAPGAYLHEHSGLTGFLAAPQHPWTYLTSNSLLRIRQDGIGHLLDHNPYPFVFNSSLWTLYWEFLCYLCLAALGLAGVTRTRRFGMLAAACALFTLFAAPPLMMPFVRSVPDSMRIIELFLYFALGSCAFLYRESIPMRGQLAALCVVAIVAALPTRAFALILPPCISYLTLYAAMKWPIRNFDRRADLSYGLYIYAFPIQQMLALFGVAGLGRFAYFAGTYMLVVPVAAASWFLIEKPSLSLKHALDRLLKAGSLAEVTQ